MEDIKKKIAEEETEEEIEEISDEEIKKVADEMMGLYLRNQLDELAKIRDDENESSVRRAGAHVMLQWPKDGRRLWWDENKLGLS